MLSKYYQNEYGDTLIKARPVEHWIYFKTENGRKSFLSKIENLNETTSFGDFPYKLHISRVDKVDHNSVDDYVLDLWDFAEECYGEYDSWEISIEKE